jgi:hypothetical protein
LIFFIEHFFTFLGTGIIPANAGAAWERRPYYTRPGGFLYLV